MARVKNVKKLTNIILLFSSLLLICAFMHTDAGHMSITWVKVLNGQALWPLCKFKDHAYTIQSAETIRNCNQATVINSVLCEYPYHSFINLWTAVLLTLVFLSITFASPQTGMRMRCVHWWHVAASPCTAAAGTSVMLHCQGLLHPTSLEQCSCHLPCKIIKLKNMSSFCLLQVSFTGYLM